MVKAISYEGIALFLVGLHGIQLVLCQQPPKPVIVETSLAEKESQLIFLKKCAKQQDDEIEYDFANVICTEATPDEKDKVCALMTMVLKGLTAQQFIALRPMVDFRFSSLNCIKKNIVFEYRAEQTLKNAPMYYCPNELITIDDEPVMASNFYVMSGSTENQLLLFLDLIYSRKIDILRPLENSVKLWQHVIVTDSDEDYVEAKANTGGRSENVLRSKNDRLEKTLSLANSEYTSFVRNNSDSRARNLEIHEGKEVTLGVSKKYV